MSKNPQVMISSREVAAILNEDPRSVQRKAKSGEYPAQKLPGLRGSYIFDRDAILKIAADRGIGRVAA